MLKTALKPKWIAALLGALIVATGFVLLSGWQFGSSTSEPPVKAEKTEVAVPLTEHVQPGTELLGLKADQIVEFEGQFIPDTQIVVENRVHDGELGYWVVSGFAVDGAPDGEAITVVRGWQAEPNPPAAAPEGQMQITGRLIPPEGPILHRDVREPYFDSVSSAELSNLWDLPLYSGFVAIHELDTDEGAVHEPGLELIHVGMPEQDAQINWLNVFYGIEWVVFAGFAFFLWYRLVRDDYQRQLDEVAEAAAAEHRQANTERNPNS
ncbi:SURF1 family protein [Glutamicibacter sp. MNS18]|uniref:SURF1 family protein n=1 Tax=Glutamicibacter sp. MNS18 TaxID=2989817 RepID=UPI0022358EC7|nr:SURF1 family cytochrome oxidase biogenesis protein [Glutamicibacter sp. MNS18]MCW4464232.1 SURF1 family protein [Glutamicibacter sp. MNS18]